MKLCLHRGSVNLTLYSINGKNCSAVPTYECVPDTSFSELILLCLAYLKLLSAIRIQKNINMNNCDSANFFTLAYELCNKHWWFGASAGAFISCNRIQILQELDKLFSEKLYVNYIIFVTLRK